MEYDDPDFLNLPPPLAKLFARAGARSFFAQPIWYHVLTRYGTDEAAHVRLYLDDPDAPHAALLCRTNPGSRRLHSLSNFYSCEHGPVIDPGTPAAPAAFLRIAIAIADERPRWDAVQLAGFDPGDPGFTLLAAAFREAGWSVHSYFDSGTWYETTAGLSFADYVAARPPALRNTWRRKAAKLGADARVAIEFHAGPAAPEDGIAAYETVYRASWKSREPYPDFVPELIRAAAPTGALRLGILRLDGMPIAAQIWLVWQGRATIYKLAHDQRFDPSSPGTVLTMAMMERVLQQDRPVEVNFGRGDDPYKRLWLGHRRERWGLLIANRATARGLALALRQTASEFIRWRQLPVGR